MDLPLLKNDITTIVRSQKPVINCRYLQSMTVTDLEISEILTAAISCGEIANTLSPSA